MARLLMSRSTQTRRLRWLQKAGLVVLVLFGLLAALVGVFLLRPTAVVSTINKTFLWFKGVRSHEARVDGNRIHFLAGGTGRPILLLHGLAGRSLDWASVIPDLVVSGYKVFAPDLLGYGASSKPDVDYSIELEAKTMERFLDSQKLVQVDVVGWSMGGWIALKLAAEHPEKVRTLTLVDSAGFIFNAPDPAVLRPRTKSELEKMAKLFSPKAGAIPAFYAQDILRSMAEQDRVIASSLKSMYSKKGLMEDKVSTITMPVLLLWGEQDVLTPLSAGYEMHRQIHDSTLHVIPGCGHMAIIECRDRAVPVLLHFLRQY